MDSVRVKISYRPLRICWAIGAGDLAAFRRALRLTFTMWGGRFNPIIIADRVEEATRIAETFRADLIVPVGDSDAVRAFAAKFPHLHSPFFPDTLFLQSGAGGGRAHVIDVYNELAYLADRPEWEKIKSQRVRLYSWQDSDPLADLFLMNAGGYPDVAGTQIDYRDLIRRAAEAEEVQLTPGEPIPGDFFEHRSISYFARHGLERQSVRSNWDFVGFFLGEASNLNDLVCCWNLRAADIAVFFVDRAHVSSFQHVIPAWSNIAKQMAARHRFEHHRQLAVWSRRNEVTIDYEAESAEVRRIFGPEPFNICHVHTHSWNGLNIQAPMMVFGQTSQLGLLGKESEKPRLSFALGEKPFCSDVWFHSQHLVASLSFIGGLYGDELHTLNPPYVPELNEFYGRTMHIEYNKFRVEPEHFGLIIGAADADAFVYALPVANLMQRIFGLGGMSACPSPGGLITRQLIAQMDGLRGAAVFKIPGVRRLLKTFGPTEPFTARDAMNKIGSRDPDNPGANFKDYENLYIESRPIGTKLDARDVFAYLVESRLFRMGAQLLCPHCRMKSWIALDVLQQQVTCEMCGQEFDATRQLVSSPCHYRRSGVMGAERNAQGAVPVVLALQQLQANLGHGLSAQMYTTSLDLKPVAESGLPVCEVDFVWLISGDYRNKAEIIIGECKDRGQGREGDGATITAADVANLKAVVDAFPADRFDTYVVLAKLCPFTPEEIKLAKTLNGEFLRRVIMLTDRELEPWHIYERRKGELGNDTYASSPEQLANVTARLYFTAPPTPPAAPQPVTT